jgi:hypothetical protein
VGCLSFLYFYYGFIHVESCRFGSGCTMGIISVSVSNLQDTRSCLGLVPFNMQG